MNPPQAIIHPPLLRVSGKKKKKKRHVIVQQAKKKRRPRRRMDPKMAPPVQAEPEIDDDSEKSEEETVESPPMSPPSDTTTDSWASASMTVEPTTEQTITYPRPGLSFFRTNSQGKLEANPEAYYAHGYGWVESNHETRSVWNAFLDGRLKRAKAIVDMPKLIAAKNWDVRRRRSRSRSRTRSPSPSP